MIILTEAEAKAIMDALWSDSSPHERYLARDIIETAKEKK